MDDGGQHEEKALSKSQVRKAGDALRLQLRARALTEVLADPSNADAWDIVRRFQRSHVEPTVQLAMAVATVAMARDVGFGPVVPRIKRVERIVEKIARHSTALDRLQDIGGCRIVVADVVTQQQVTARLMELPFELVDVDDHVAVAGASPFEPDSRGPKGSGYRAIHLVHRVDGCLLETQVRTAVQHQWAVAVERAEQITGFPLKFGDAPPELLDYFRVASTIHALQERAEDVDAELANELAELRERIRRYYRRSR